MESSEGKKRLLDIPGLALGHAWQLHMAPRVFKDNFVYICFYNKVVLINIKRRTYTVKEINRGYGNIASVSLNGSETLLAFSTFIAGLKIFNVQCGVDGEIDLAKCNGQCLACLLLLCNQVSKGKHPGLSSDVMSRTRSIVLVVMERSSNELEAAEFDSEGLVMDSLIIQTRTFLLHSLRTA